MAGSSSSYNFDPIFIDPDEGVGSAQEKLSPKKHSAVKTQSIRRKFLWQSFKFIAKWLISFLIIGVIALFLLVKLSDHIISDLPDPRALADPRENVSIRVKSATGDDIGIRGSYFAGEVKLSDVSPHLLNAIMAVEDRNFYTHFGFDPAGILRALLKNMQSGRVVQGASTLTQQLAKDLFLDAERSYARKIKELLYAIKIESTYSKDRIFELYLNRVYLGAGLYGVKAAAERYFGKHPRDLNIAESALIAGLLKAPSRYAPTNNPVRSHERAAVAVEAMYRTGYITQSERDYAVAFPAEFQMSVLGKGFGYVADRITDIVPRLIGSLDRDVIVTTTINSHLQAISDVLVDDFVSNMGTQKGFQQAAFIALDDNGAVLAMTGGKSYAETPFNRTMQAFRQPGSAFKPFVYAAAFERGLKPWDVVVDEDISFGNYRPTNYKNKYEGAMSARTAFAKSVNTIAVKLAYRSGIKNVKAIAEKAGIVSSIKPYLSMSLGAFEVTPLELTSAYIPFFNGGYGVSPHLVTKITTPDGEILFEQNSNSLNRSERIYSPQTIHHMKDIFHAVTSYGTG
ncbi:MAG: transglycosylase domain-containing protein, partial [Pseudomonadota bacterium]